METQLLEFWATGCRQSLPCHQAVQRLQAANEIGMTISSIDAWDHPYDVAAYRILRLPTLVLTVDGIERARWSPTRAVSPAMITAWVVEQLPHSPVRTWQPVGSANRLV